MSFPLPTDSEIFTAVKALHDMGLMTEEEARKGRELGIIGYETRKLSDRTKAHAMALVQSIGRRFQAEKESGGKEKAK